jgi:hypothetical protein
MSDPETRFSNARLEMLCDGHALRENAMLSAALTIALLNGLTRRLDRATSARAPVPSA